MNLGAVRWAARCGRRRRAIRTLVAPGYRPAPAGTWALGLPAGTWAPATWPLAGLAVRLLTAPVPDLFTPATLAAFKSTLSPTCGRGERGEQIRHSRYGPEKPAPSDLQWGSTPGEPRSPRGEPARISGRAVVDHEVWA